MFGEIVPRFFFDITSDNVLHRDEAGDECDDLADACAQAQALLPDILRDEGLRGELHTVHCGVRDETGRVVYTGEITFKGRQHSTAP